MTKQGLLNALKGPSATGTTIPAFAPREPSFIRSITLDPLLWLLDKINRPQQALFEAINRSQRGGSFFGGLAEGFVHGSNVRATDILDEMGLRGQAGQFDWLDLVAGTMELGLDPINLVSFGAAGAASKVGKAQKVGRVAGSLGISAAELEKLGQSSKIATEVLTRIGAEIPPQSAELLRSVVSKMGGTPTENMLPKLIARAEQLLVPDPGTTFARVGLGARRAAIPGSNIVLEKSQLLPAFRAIRRSRVGQAFSTAAETPGAALLKATEQIIKDARIGAFREASVVWRSFVKQGTKIEDFATGSRALDNINTIKAAAPSELGFTFKDAAEEYLTQAMEIGGSKGRELLEGAPDTMKEVFEINHFLGEILPAIDQKAHLAVQPFKRPDLIEVLEAGQGRKLAQEYTPRILDGEMLDYVAKNDDFLGMKVAGRTYRGNSPRTGGFYQSARTVSDMIASINGYVRNPGRIINTPKKAAELGKLFTKGGHGDLIFRSIGDKAFFDELGTFTNKDIIRKAVESGDITAEEGLKLSKIRAGLDEPPLGLAEAPSGLAEIPPARGLEEFPEFGVDVPPSRISPDPTAIRFADRVKSALPEATDAEIADGFRRLTNQANEAIANGAQGTADDYINNWLIDNLEQRGFSKVRQRLDRLNRFKADTSQIKELLNLTDDQARFDTLYKNAYHRKKFKRFYSTNWGLNMAKRLGEDYINRSSSAMLEAVINNPIWARQVVKIEREGTEKLGRNLAKKKASKVTFRPGSEWEDVEKAVDGAASGWDELVLPKKMLAGLDDEFINKIDEHIFAPEILKDLQKGLNLIYDPKQIEELAKTFGSFMSKLRASTILPFAGYHINNMMGNRWARFVGGTGLDIGSDIDAIRVGKAIARGDAKSMSQTVKIKGRDVKMSEIFSDSVHNNVLTGGKFTQDVWAPGTLTAAETGREVRLLERLSPVSREQFGAQAARMIEDHDRLAHFIGRLKLGDTVEGAARSVDIHLFRYEDLTGVEQAIRSGTFFFTWYRKNIGLTMQKLWEYPARMTMPLKIKNAFDGAFGTPESEYAVPQYLTDQIYLYFGTDAAGKSLIFDPEKWLPPLSAGKFFADFPTGTMKEVVSSLVPPARLAVETAINREVRTGREIEAVPGEFRKMFGMEMPAKVQYFASQFRLIKAINDTLFPEAERDEGRVRRGAPGRRTFGEVVKAGAKAFGGFGLLKIDAQKNRYFAAISPSGELNAKLDKIQSKLAGDVSPNQRESFLRKRTDILWEKAEAIRQMIADGTDPFTGKPLEWEPPMPEPGVRKPNSMREYYTGMYSTLRDLYFGEPPEPGVLTVDPKTRLDPQMLDQVFSAMVRTKFDMLQRDSEFATKNKAKKVMDNRVLDPIRDILRTPDFYKRSGDKPSFDTHLYNYPASFKVPLLNLFHVYLDAGFRAGLYDENGFRTRMKNFREDYEIDYI